MKLLYCDRFKSFLKTLTQSRQGLRQSHFHSPHQCYASFVYRRTDHNGKTEQMAGDHKTMKCRSFLDRHSKLKEQEVHHKNGTVN